jgi:hypothetical protein
VTTKRVPAQRLPISGDPHEHGVIAELKAAGLDAERDMAKRAGSEITEIDASHAVPAMHPGDVAAVIVRAVKAVT